MTHRKLIELNQNSTPQALIIGGDTIADYLELTLQERGCQAIKIENDKKAGGKFDYIFLFGNFSQAEDLLQHHLVTGGKFLFIETAAEPHTPVKKIKILKIGDPSVLNPAIVVEKILSTIFSGKDGNVVNISQKPLIPAVATAGPPPKSTPVRKQVTPLIVKKRRFISRKFILFFFLVFIFAAGILIAGSYYNLKKMENTYTYFRQHLASSDWKSLAGDITQARNEVHTVQKSYDLLSLIIFPIRSTDFSRNITGLLAASDSLLASGGELLNFSQGLSANKNTALAGQGISIGDFEELKTKVDIFRASIISAKKQMEKTDIPFFPKEDFLIFLSSAYNKLTSINDVAPMVEEFLAAVKPRTYLILFQNNMELRSTGGFIGSYAILQIDNGHISDFRIEDVYTADGQLKGHVEPPAAFRKYMSQPHYFLRDSNFDPDFAVSGEKAAWFLEKELGTKVDGVIGINLFLAQKILKVIGPVQLADFNNEKISAENFFQKEQQFVEKDFFPGSTQKKDFLTALNNTIIAKLTSDQHFLFSILPVIKQAFEEKNILLYTRDSTLQKMIEEKGYGGRMAEVKCTDSTDGSGNFIGGSICFSDYLSVIETNLGVNKVNYFISKSVTVEKKIGGDGKISSVVTLSYENDSLPEINKGNNTYTNYLRLFVPLGSKLNSVTLNGFPIPLSDIDIENYQSDKISIGFLVKIAPENKGVVKISYDLPRSIAREDKYYQLLFQKQGGDKLAPIVLSLTYPVNFSFKPFNFPSTSGRENEIYFTADTSVDRIFSLVRN